MPLTNPSSGSTGVDYFEPSWTLRAAYGRVNSTATYDLGLALTATGTNALVTQTNVSLLRSLARSQRSTGTTAEAYAGWRDADFQLFRRNGFKVQIIGGVNTIAGADSRFFMGLTSDSLLNTDEDPVDFDNPLAFAMDAADSNWQLMHNNGATGATKTDTTIALAADELIQADFVCAAGGSTASVSFTRWTGTSRTPASTYTTTVSTNLPSDTLALYPYWWAGNNGTAASTIIDLVAMKVWC